MYRDAQVIMMKLVTLFTVLSTVCCQGQAADPEPQNTVALFKNDTILRCRQYSNDVVWQFYEVGKTRKDSGKLISARGRIQPQFMERYSLNRTLSGQHDLLIKDVHSEDAGIYECAKKENNQPSAHLTVLHDPVCSIRDKNGVVSYVTQSDTIRLSCSVLLAGHCQPILEWSLDDGTIIESTSFKGTNSKLRTVFLESNFTVNADKETIGFKFTISFTCPPNDYDFKNLSSINPEYKHVWRSHDVRVITESTESESHTLFPITATTTERIIDGGEGYTKYFVSMISLMSVVSGVVLLMLLAKLRRGIRCWQRCKSQHSVADVYDDIPRSKGSHTSSVKQIDWKERSSLSTHTSDNHSMGYATSPRKVSLPSLPRPESIDNELIATYAETRIFASNIFMSGGSTSQLSQKRTSLVEDNTSIYSKVIKPKPSKTSEFDSISFKGSRTRQETIFEDSRLQKHVNNDILNKYRRVGADGTTYSELDGFGSQHNRRNQPVSQQVRQNKPIYADMDHTLNQIRARPPPPIPTLSPPD